MAVVSNGVQVSLPSSVIPLGFTPPAMVNDGAFTDYEYVRRETLTILRSSVYNADRATTLTNILTQISVGVSDLVDAIMTADYVAANAVNYYTDVRGINHNIRVNGSSDFYNADAVNYIITADIYVKTA